MNRILLELENTGVFKGEQTFELAKGLNIIYAPNASGKSSLIAGLKAVTIPLESEELKKVLNDYEDSGFVKLSIDDQEFMIKLTRKDDGTIIASGKVFSNNGIVSKVAFIDLENELVSAIYSGNEERTKEILREISGVNYFETIISVLSGLRSEYEHRWQIRKLDYESRKEEIEREEKEVESRLQEIRKRINEILSKVEIEHVKKEMEEIEKQLKDLDGKLSEIRTREIEIKNEKELKRRDLTKINSDLEFYYEKRDNLLKEKDAITEKLVDIKREIENLSLEIKELKSKIDKITSEILEKDKILKRRREVKEFAICPYCGNQMEKSRIESEILKLENEIINLRKRREELFYEVEARERRIKELRQSGEERLKSIDEELEELDRKIEELEQEKGKIENKLRKLNEEEKEKENERRKKEEEYELLVRRLKLLEKEYPEASKLVGEYEKLKIEENQLSERRDRLHTRRAQLDEIYKDAISEQKRAETSSLLEEYFRIRLNEIKKLSVNNINEVVSRNFKLLRLAELEFPILSEDFELRLTRSGGVPTTLTELSDAEKAILVIAITFSLKECIAEDFPFYVIDTLIEFIDDARAKEVLNYLMNAAGNTAIVVTKTKAYSGESKFLTQENILVNKIPV
jgi:chromosome segregation ATPase